MSDIDGRAEDWINERLGDLRHERQAQADQEWHESHDYDPGCPICQDIDEARAEQMDGPYEDPMQDLGEHDV